MTVSRDSEDFYGEGFDGELEYRSELVHDLPEPDTDAPSDHDSGDGNDSGSSDGDSDSSGASTE